MGFPVRSVLSSFLLSIVEFRIDGMIIFPATGVFADLGGMGVSMFFLSTVIAQLVFTLGGSGFAGANGSMMIEVVVRLLSCFVFLSLLRRRCDAMLVVFRCVFMQPCGFLCMAMHPYVFLCFLVLFCTFTQLHALCAPFLCILMCYYHTSFSLSVHFCATSHLLRPSSHPCYPCAPLRIFCLSDHSCASLCPSLHPYVFPRT